MKDLKDLDSFAFSSPSMQAANISKSVSVMLAAFKEANHSPKNVLAVGESWAAMGLREQGLSVTYLSEAKPGEKFDTILAIDEVMCRFRSESQQKQAIVSMLGYLQPGGLALISLRDYRNGHFHRRPLGDTVMNIIDGEELITVEVNHHDPIDKQAWNQKMFIIQNQRIFSSINCGDRRTLYFKQLAKYCADIGLTQFGVFKDIFWRGSWRRTPEHIAWIRGA